MLRAALIALWSLIAPQMALAQICPAPLAGVHRLLLVVPDTTRGTTAYAQRFGRTSIEAKWRPASGPFTALLGYRGVASAHAFRRFAEKG